MRQRKAQGHRDMASDPLTPAPPPPGDRGLPVVGEAFALLADPFAFVRERAARHGPVVRSRLMSRDLVVLSGPQTADAFLDEANVRRSGAMPPHVAALFGTGVVNQLDGVAHRARKQHVMRALDGAALAHYLPQIRALLRARMARWHAAGEVALQDETVLATLELVLANFAGLSESDAVCARYAKGFADVAGALFGFPVALPGTALRRAQAFTRELRGRLAAVVAERRRHPTGDGASRLVASEVEGARLTDEDIAKELFHLAAAGGGIWAWCCRGVKALADDPALRDRLTRAVNALEPEASGRALGEVALLDAFVREVKRTGWVFPFTAFGVAARTFTVAGHTVPKGWLVTWSTHASHVVDGVAPYASPGSFDPDRFLPGRGDGGEGRAPHAFAPQGPGSALGTHRCAGVEYSTLVLQVFFTELLRGAHFTLPPQDFRLDGSTLPARYRGSMRVRFE
ncbi:MAG: cytochrome P450 [Rubrivivax sp.]|nr:cytochrome P450 [Rubrivivax sp.]